MRRSYSFSFETGENVSVSLFAPNQKVNFSDFIKLNLFVFVRDGGKCERFTFRFVSKKWKRNWRTLLEKCSSRKAICLKVVGNEK